MVVCLYLVWSVIEFCICVNIIFLVTFVCNRNSQFHINILACEHLIDTRKSFSLVLYVVLLCFIQVKICEPAAIQFYTDSLAHDFTDQSHIDILASTFVWYLWNHPGHLAPQPKLFSFFWVLTIYIWLGFDTVAMLPLSATVLLAFTCTHTTNITHTEISFLLVIFLIPKAQN